MKFNVQNPDVQYPEEEKETFKWRFLSSLQASFQDAANQSKISAAVLHVRSGLSRTFWERVRFWKAPRFHNLPLKARWAAEALCEQGYEWRIDWFKDNDTGRKHPAIWVNFPWGCYDPQQLALFMNPVAASGYRAPLLLESNATAKVPPRARLKLVWNRDKQ